MCVCVCMYQCAHASVGACVCWHTVALPETHRLLIRSVAPGKVECALGIGRWVCDVVLPAVLISSVDVLRVVFI